MSTLAQRAFLLAAVALLLLACGPAALGGNQGQGQGSNRVRPFAEIQTTDASIATFSATPSSSDPGPVARDNADKMTFNTRWTNARHLVTLDVSAATDGSGSSSKTVQGSTHTIADWVYLRQDAITVFGTVQATGTYDAAGASYTPPGGFTKDSQGTLVLRIYDKDAPPDGGAAVTVYWIYESASDAYWFDAADRDFTNDNGEERVYPASNTLHNEYSFFVQGLEYVITSVAGAGANYVPTASLGWHRMPGPSGGHDFDVYALMDFPSGAPADTYSFTVRATTRTTK